MNFEVFFKIFNSIILELSFWAVLIAFFVILFDLIKNLSKKEILFFCFSVASSFLLRLKYGLFAPWHPQDHYVGIFFNFKNNALANFFNLPNVYTASGGLFEILYKRIMFFSDGFNVYHVYFLGLFLNILAGILIFALAWNLFKNKFVAFISFYIFAFLPLLIKISATEVFFIINAITILLFANLVFYIFKRKDKLIRFYVLLFFIYCANLLGRKEYLAFFIVGFFSFFVLVLIFNKNIRKKIFDNFYIIITFIFFCIVVSFIYFLAWVFPNIKMVVDGPYGFSENFFRLFFNSFLIYKPNTHSYAPYLRLFFTPVYFSVLLFVAPLVLLIKKKWFLLVFDIIFLALLIPMLNIWLTDFRFVLPLLFFLIPQVGYVMYVLFKENFFSFKIKLSSEKVLIISLIIIIFSTFQCWYFLKSETARKKEQDFLIKHIKKTVPNNSLILTVAQKKYKNSKFEFIGKDYKYCHHGLEFPGYLIPEKKNIDVMDIYKEYNPEVIKNYKNVFYYRGLYSYHERDINNEITGSCEEGLKSYNNILNKKVINVVEDFEEKHKLVFVEGLDVKNVGFEIFFVKDFLRGFNASVRAEGVLGINLYKIN